MRGWSKMVPLYISATHSYFAYLYSHYGPISHYSGAVHFHRRRIDAILVKVVVLCLTDINLLSYLRRPSVFNFDVNVW